MNRLSRKQERSSSADLQQNTGHYVAEDKTLLNIKCDNLKSCNTNMYLTEIGYDNGSYIQFDRDHVKSDARNIANNNNNNDDG
jgi:hypothetical protein